MTPADQPPTDETLAAFVLGDLPPADAAAVTAASADPAVGRRVRRVRAVVAALSDAAAQGVLPPAGLAADTAARAPVIEPIRPRWRAGRVVSPGFDVAVLAGIVVLLVGLGATAVNKVREESRAAACRNRLREMHLGLDGYASLRGDRYPEVGTPSVPVAGAVFAELERAGQLAPGPANCPAGGAYTYTLGYRAGGRVTGLRKSDGDNLPILADAPGDRGLNVLFVGGTVRFSTTPAVGVGGDDITRNRLGLPRAGVDRDDSSLGGPADAP